MQTEQKLVDRAKKGDNQAFVDYELASYKSMASDILKSIIQIKSPAPTIQSV